MRAIQVFTLFFISFFLFFSIDAKKKIPLTRLKNEMIEYFRRTKDAYQKIKNYGNEYKDKAKKIASIAGEYIETTKNILERENHPGYKKYKFWVENIKDWYRLWSGRLWTLTVEGRERVKHVAIDVQETTVTWFWKIIDWVKKKAKNVVETLGDYVE